MEVNSFGLSQCPELLLNFGSSEWVAEAPSMLRGEEDGDRRGNACEGPEWLELILYLPPPAF